ncbi:MAG: tetratricopeptide repeat protein [Proteobacteria bacterium]|nr:tetratricopeptide repeat protein [Pseudomonadota bacterium]
MDTRDGYHLWSKTFDRDASGLFRIQSEIASAVAAAFDYQEPDTLATGDRVTQTSELETYELFLLGLHQLHSETASNLLLAIEYFESAIAKDPGYARAYAGLSESFSDLYDLRGDQDLLHKAEAAAEFALQLDDQSADSYRAIGFVKSDHKDYSGAEAAFTKAIELNPNDVKAYSYLAAAYRRQGRESESFNLLQKSLQLHPMSGRLNNRVGLHYWSKAGEDWDTAFEYFTRAMERDPNYPYSYWYVGHYYYSTGQPDRAIPYVSKVVDLTSGPTKAGVMAELLTMIYVDMGDYESAGKFVRRMKEIEADHFSIINAEIQLQIARGNFSVARDHVHSTLAVKVGIDWIAGLMAFYEMVIGDTVHAEEIYAHLASRPEPSGYRNEANLYRSNELEWGMLGAVNLAYLNKRNQDTQAAQELLRKAREFIELDKSPLYSWYTGSSFYVLAQIAAVEGNNETAIEYFREAVEAGWTKSWFGRIDPIMADLRKDARYLQILEELEDRLLKMRERTEVLALN